MCLSQQLVSLQLANASQYFSTGTTGPQVSLPTALFSTPAVATAQQFQVQLIAVNGDNSTGETKSGMVMGNIA
jgi:hypothetical protein